ncbi:MAG: hypothetical protein AB7W16_10910 [Candidatus Obscuribacterales bacterium]
MLINRPVFEYSLKLGESPSQELLPWLLIIVAPSGLIAAPKLLGLPWLCQFDPDQIAGFLIHPAFWCPLAVTMGIIMNFLGAGLVFTRNLNRFEYVSTVFAARALLILALAITATLALQLTALAMGKVPIFFDLAFLAQLALNAISASATTVLIYCLPVKIAIALPFALAGIIAYDLLADTYIVCTTDCEPTLNMTLPLLKPLHYWSSELLPQFPSISVLAGSKTFDWLAVVSYLSNNLLYLLLSAWALSRKDFNDA